MYVNYLILRRPEELATTENHISWTHMYRMMFAAQISFIIAYWPFSECPGPAKCLKSADTT